MNGHDLKQNDENYLSSETNFENTSNASTPLANNISANNTEPIDAYDAWSRFMDIVKVNPFSHD